MRPDCGFIKLDLSKKKREVPAILANGDGLSKFPERFP